MIEIHGLVAYPSEPTAIGTTLGASVGVLRNEAPFRGLATWEENDIAGRFIVSPILARIEKGNLLIADITRLNFNVVFEIGFAIGKKKRAFLISNATLSKDNDLIREVGLFDTLGCTSYTNSEQLTGILRGIRDLEPMKFDGSEVNTASPVYVLLPRLKGDAEIRIISRVKKARLQFRSFDPDEQGRLPAGEAVDNVASSHGVVVPLLSKDHVEAQANNLRGAFVAGLVHGMGKQLLLLQASNEPVPLDYRDLVSQYKTVDQINERIATFAANVTALLQAEAGPVVAEPKTFLAKLNLGASAAENEMLELGNYYLETDEYRRVLRGEVQVVAGRKGAGKTALFAQVRNRLRQNKQTIVLDLKPEGYQLLKFKEQVLDLLEEGTKEHTITAFWEYLLLLEACHKILEKDRVPHLRDHRLFDTYQALSRAYAEDAFIAEGDFAERMLKLIQRIVGDFHDALGTGAEEQQLSAERITELLYKHDVPTLRRQLTEYLTNKDGLWILFDNLDKGWPPHGIRPDDLITLRCLMDAMAKLERALRKRDIESRGVVFIRNDVYELLIETTPDRGKVSQIALDWTDAELLRELLRRRFIYSGLEGDLSFERVWRQACVSHIGGEESSQYMIDRCLMRPRALINLLRYCRSHAVNLGHEKIEVEDVRHGEEAYSTDLVTNISFEIRDVFPEAQDALYEFIESPWEVDADTVWDTVRKITDTEAKRQKVLDLLLWYGFLGFRREDGDTAYVYSVKYDLKRLKALIERRAGGKPVYRVNPAFWRGLEIQHLGVHTPKSEPPSATG